MINLEDDGNTVTVHGIAICRLHGDDGSLCEESLDIIRDLVAGDDPIAMGPALYATLCYTYVNTHVCPDCGSENFRWWEEDVNGVDIGFCIDCSVHVYRYRGAIHRQWDNKCGHAERVNLLRRVTQVPTPEKALAYSMD